jgi:hypothetical protein
MPIARHQPSSHYIFTFGNAAGKPFSTPFAPHELKLPQKRRKLAFCIGFCRMIGIEKEGMPGRWFSRLILLSYFTGVAIHVTSVNRLRSSIPGGERDVGGRVF